MKYREQRVQSSSKEGMQLHGNREIQKCLEAWNLDLGDLLRKSDSHPGCGLDSSCEL